jgi:hypothetical protein
LKLGWLSLLFAATVSAAVERSVTPGAAGPNRLDVDVALLSKAAADLRDLRLLDAQQREVGYILVEPDQTAPQWIDGRMLPVASTKKTSGFEVDLGHVAKIDRLKLTGIAAPFLKRARVEGSGDRTHWTLLADATLFDLPDDKLRLLEVPFAPDAFRYLRVTWNDASSAPITNVGNASARVHASGTPAEPLRANVAYRRRASEPGKSRYRLVLPGTHLPLAAIELRVSNGNVFREATITEPRLGNGEVVPVNLGSGTLRRAERWGAVAEEMAIGVQRPEGRELDLVVDDGNNPPLALTGIVARFTPQPWIYFEAPAAAPLTARYGVAGLNAPHYDLEASRRYVAGAKVEAAKWSETAQDAAPEVATDTVASLQGATVDRAAFQVVRPLPAAPAGLTVLVLDADALARSRELADLRIVTKDDHQVPYLVEKRDEPLVLPLTLQKSDSPRGSSVYRLQLPYATLPYGSRLVLKTSARVFERNVTLRRPSEERRRSASLATMSWRTADPELLPPALTLDLPMSGGRSLEVVLEEGDNAPLPLVSAELLLPSAALRFHHPGTALFLLYANRAADAPRYDLALLAPRLFGQPAHELTLPPLPIAPTTEDNHGERKFFWIAIAVAVLVLLALLARLLKTERAA